MASDLPEKLTHKIEVLCALGCTQVNQLLDRAKSGEEIEELSGYSPSEVNQVINELTQIMSVYDDKS